MSNAADTMAPEFMIRYLTLAEVAAIMIAREDGDLSAASNVRDFGNNLSDTTAESDVVTVRPNH